jgi:hypothetical protein
MAVRLWNYWQQLWIAMVGRGNAQKLNCHHIGRVIVISGTHRTVSLMQRSHIFGAESVSAPDYEDDKRDCNAAMVRMLTIWQHLGDKQQQQSLNWKFTINGIVVLSSMPDWTQIVSMPTADIFVIFAASTCNAWTPNIQRRNRYPAPSGLVETALASRTLYHSICEDTFLDPLCASTAELSVDLGWMYDGKDHHDEEHEQRVEDIQEHFMWNEVSVIA